MNVGLRTLLNPPSAISRTICTLISNEYHAKPHTPVKPVGPDLYVTLNARSELSCCRFHCHCSKIEQRPANFAAHLCMHGAYKAASASRYVRKPPPTAARLLEHYLCVRFVGEYRLYYVRMHVCVYTGPRGALVRRLQAL
jgi:hypothetical protein